MVQNSAYAGLWTFNRYEWIKNPDTGKRNYRERPRDQWVTQELPHLRIIDPDTWAAAQQRVARRRLASQGKKGQQKKTYLLSGLVTCVCGRAMTISAGFYACPARTEQGICTSSVRFRVESLESLVVQTLSSNLVPFIVDLLDQANRMLLSRDHQRTLRELREEEKRAIAELEQQATPIELTDRQILLALDHLDEVLATEVILAREFLAGLLTRIEISPISSEPKDTRDPPQKRPVCSMPVRKMAPQHAAVHGLSLDELRRRYPESGVNQPVEVLLRPNLRGNQLERSGPSPIRPSTGSRPTTASMMHERDASVTRRFQAHCPHGAQRTTRSLR